MPSLLPLLFVGLLGVDLGIGPPPIPTAIEPTDRERVQALLVQIAGADAARRATAIDQLIALGPAYHGPLSEALYRPRGALPDQLRPVILLTGAQVPNWKSSDPLWITRTEPKWVPQFKGEKRPRRPPPPDPETVDWLAALQKIDLLHADLVAIDPAARVLAQLEAIEVTALLRALGATRQPAAVAPLFRFAFEPEGIFRDECGRQIRVIGDAAVPELVPLQHRSPLPKMRRYAAFQLDRLDRANPKKALAAMPEDRLRAALLHQYGEVRALDSVEPVLDYVDADSLRVRREARHAWLRFVAGKAPPPAPKRHRKLPGGREETDEKPDYLTYRELAELAIKKRLATELPELQPGKATAEELTQQLFAHYDGRRAERWRAVYDAAVVAYDRGDATALGTMTDLLAHEPAFEGRGAIGARLLEQADKKRSARELPAAISLYRQGIALVPEAQRPRWEARLLLAEGLQAEKAGRADRTLYEQALALDPELREARGAIGKLHLARPSRSGLASLLVVALLGVGLLVGGLLWRRRLGKAT